MFPTVQFQSNGSLKKILHAVDALHAVTALQVQNSLALCLVPMFLDQTRPITAEILALVQWPKVQSSQHVLARLASFFAVSCEPHPEVDEVDSSSGMTTSAGGFSPSSG